MERAWNTISNYINSLFYHRTMNRYIKAANIVKQKVDEYLREKNIKFTSKIVDDGEYYWPRVAVKVIVDLYNYDEVLKLWDELCKVGYKDISKENVYGIFIYVEPNWYG